MKNFIRNLLISFFAMTAIAHADPAAITMGFIPADDPVTLLKKTNELAALLSKEHNIKVKSLVSADYQSLVKEMKNGNVDFAFFTATTFVQAESEVPMKVLLKKVFSGPYYYSVLVTRKDSKIKSIADLKGKKIGFVDAKSGSGYLYPLEMFKSKNIEPEKYFSKVLFSGNHEKSIYLINNKEVDAVAVFADDAANTTGAITKYLGVENLKNFRTLWTSEPIPNDPLCVRKDFYEKYPKLTHDLMFSLIEASEHWPEQTDLLKYLGIRQLAFATTRQYDPVRKLLKLSAPK